MIPALSQDERNKLDKNIRAMIEGGASNNDIVKYTNEYKDFLKKNESLAGGLKSGGKVGTSEARLVSEKPTKKLTYNDLEQLYVNVNEADKKLGALSAGKKGIMGAFIPKTEIDIATKDLSQAQRKKEETLIEYQKELEAPVKRLIDTGEYKQFFDADVFNEAKAREHFKKITQKYGGGSYLVDSWMANLKKQGQFEKDKPRFSKLFDEELAKEKIDFKKYGQKVFDNLAKNQYDNVELIKKDAESEVAQAETQAKQQVQTSAQKFNEYVNGLNKNLEAGIITPAEASEMYDAELQKLNNGVQEINTNYLDLVRNINTRVNKKYGRVEQELKRISQTISDADVLNALPESDRQKIKAATGRAASRLQAEKNDIKKAALSSMAKTPLPGAGEWATNLSNSFLSGFNSGLANLGDWLFMSGADNRVVDWMRDKKSTAAQFAPPKYEWNKDEWVNRTITSAGSSLGASVPSLLPTIAIGAVTGGAGVAPVLATGLTSFAIENAQNAGQQYQQKLEETGDPNAAAQSANELFRKNTIALPLSFAEGLGDMMLFKGGAIKKAIAGFFLEQVGEVPTEYIQSFNEAKINGYKGSIADYVKENPEIAYDTVLSTIGQGGIMSSVGQAFSAFSKKVPESYSQFFANMVQKEGVEFAQKVLETYYTKGVIDKTEYENQKGNLEQIATRLQKLGDAGVRGNDAILMTSLTSQSEELQDKVNTEQDEAAKAVYQKQLSEVKSDISQLASSQLPYVAFTMPGGQGGTRIMTVKEFQALPENEANELIRNSDGVQVVNDDTLNASLNEKKKQLGVPRDAPEGAYPNTQPTPQVPAEPKMTEAPKITFENSKEGDVVLHNGEEVTIVSKGKSRGGADIVEVVKSPKTKEQIKAQALQNVFNRVESQYTRLRPTWSDIEANHPSEVRQEIEELTALENSKTSTYTIDAEQWNNEVESKSEKAPEVKAEVVGEEVAPEVPATEKPIKPEEYAVPITPAGQVPIQPETGVSEEVEGRTPEARPEKLATKEETEVAAQEEIKGGKPALTLAQKVVTSIQGKAESIKKEVARRLRKYAEPEGKRSEINKLIQDVYKFNNQKRGRLGLKTIESLKKRNELILEAKRLGFETKVDKEGRIKVKGKGARFVDKSNSNMSIDQNYVPLENRGEKVKNLVERLNSLAEVYGYDFQSVLPNVIIGADGKKMDARQIANAIKDLNDGIPSKGANLVLNALEEMAESGTIEIRVGQEVTGIGIDEFFDEMVAIGERDEARLTKDAETLPEKDLVKWVEEMAEEQTFENEEYEPDTTETEAEGGAEPETAATREQAIKETAGRPVPETRRGAPPTKGGEELEVELPQPEKKVSGIKKALVSEEVLKGVDINTVGDKELLSMGRKIIESGEVVPRELIDAIIEAREGVLTPAQVVALITYKADLDIKIEGIENEIARRKEAGESLGDLELKLNELNTERNNFDIAAVITANQQSMAFRLRRFMLDREYNVTQAINRYKKANNGVIPADVEAEFKNVGEDIKEINKQLDAEEKKVEKERGERAAQNIVADVKREQEGTKKKTYKEKAKSVADNFRKLKKKPYKFTDENGNEFTPDIMGISVWDRAIEAGAKAIEISGQIADGIAAAIEVFKDTDFYKNLSGNDKKRFEDSLEDYYAKEIESTPEAKKLKRLQKQLDDLIAKKVKNTSPSYVEDSPEVKELREKIFEAKKNLGLIKSKMKKPAEVEEVPRPSINEDGSLSIPEKFIRDLAASGKTTIEEVTDAAFKELEPQLPGLTKRQVRDAITRYGEKVNPTIDEVKRDINKARRIGRLLSELEDLKSMSATDFALKYRKKKPSERKISQVEKNLQRQVNALKKELDIDGRIDDAIKSAQDSMAEYERRIRELDFSAKEGLPETPELKKAIDERDALRKQYQALKDSTTKNKLEASKRAARREIEKLEERLRTGNYDMSKPKKAKPIDAELYILNAKKQALIDRIKAKQRQIEDKNKTTKQKAIDVLVELANISRTLVAGFFDLGAMFTQGAWRLFSNPVMSAKAFSQSVIQAFSERKHDQWIAKVRSSPLYPLMEASGLSLSDPDGKLSEQEGIFITRYANAIYNFLASVVTFGYRPATKFVKSISPIKFSQRAYDGYMNYIRVASFAKFAKSLEQSGYSPASNPEVFKATADFINTSTGRGTLGAFEKAAKGLSAILFAPRKVAAELKLFTPYAFIYYGQMPSSVRKKALLDFGKFAMNALVFHFLAKAALDSMRGEDEEEDLEFWNSDSPNFLSFKIGNQRVSFLGGIKTTLVFMSRLWGNTFVDQFGRESKFGERIGKKINTKLDLMQSFAMGKLAPTPGLIRDLSDRNPNIDNDDEIYKSLVMPIWLQDAKELKKDNPLEMQALFNLLGFIGANVRTVDADKMMENIAFKDMVKGEEITYNVKLTEEQLQDFQDLYNLELEKAISRVSGEINMAAGPEERKEIVDAARVSAKKAAQEKLERKYKDEFRDFPQREKKEKSSLLEKAKLKLQ